MMTARESRCPDLAAAATLVIREGGLVLAIWNEKHKCWGLPGGKRERYDEIIRSTADRELLEETGLDSQKLVWLYAGPYESVSGDGQREVHLYWAQSVSGEVRERESALAWLEWQWLLNAASAFRDYYNTALPSGISHIRPTEFQ